MIFEVEDIHRKPLIRMEGCYHNNKRGFTSLKISGSLRFAREDEKEAGASMFDFVSQTFLRSSACYLDRFVSLATTTNPAGSEAFRRG